MNSEGISVVKKLCDFIDPNETDCMQRTPLHTATVYGNGDIIKFLISKASAHICLKDKFNKTPFDYANERLEPASEYIASSLTEDTAQNMKIISLIKQFYRFEETAQPFRDRFFKISNAFINEKERSLNFPTSLLSIIVKFLIY